MYKYFGGGFECRLRLEKVLEGDNMEKTTQSVRKKSSSPCAKKHILLGDNKTSRKQIRKTTNLTPMEESQ